MDRQERREHPRSSLAMPAQVRRLAISQPAMVCDLSTDGCRLESSNQSLDPGNRVLIRPQGFESLLGTVIWVHDGKAGVKFDEPLQQASVDQFCRMFPDPGTSVLLDIAA
jgi:hypothetical protein